MLENKKGIIFGVANKRSIAWATAQALHDAGATLAFTYQGERLKENVESLTAGSMSDSLLLACDVTNQAEVDETFKKVGEEFGKLDFLIHSIAYAPREALDGEYLDSAALVRLRPQVPVAGRVEQRDVDAHPVAGPLHAS